MPSSNNITDNGYCKHVYWSNESHCSCLPAGKCAHTNTHASANACKCLPTNDPQSLHSIAIQRISSSHGTLWKPMATLTKYVSARTHRKLHISTSYGSNAQPATGTDPKQKIHSQPTKPTPNAYIGIRKPHMWRNLVRVATMLKNTKANTCLDISKSYL